jgi:hypothetical protein
MTRELARASSSPVVRESRNMSGATLRGSPPRYQSSHGKAPTAGSIQTLNAENAGTTQRAGLRRSVGGALGSLSGS